MPGAKLSFIPRFPSNDEFLALLSHLHILLYSGMGLLVMISTNKHKQANKHLSLHHSVKYWGADYVHPSYNVYTFCIVSSSILAFA